MEVLFTSNYCLLPRALLEKHKAQCHLTGFQAIIIMIIIIINTKPTEPQPVNTPHWNVIGMEKIKIRMNKSLWYDVERKKKKMGFTVMWD